MMQVKMTRLEEDGNKLLKWDKHKKPCYSIIINFIVSNREMNCTVPAVHVPKWPGQGWNPIPFG
jgi:hypothetical protein